MVYLPPSGRQYIAATVILTGEQGVNVDAYDRGPGSHLSLSTRDTMITLHTRKAANVYAGAWFDAKASAFYLPPARQVTVERLAERQPGVVVAGHADDQVRTIYNPAGHTARDRHELRIRIGYLTWVVLDQQAFDSMHAAWKKISRMAPLVLPAKAREPIASR